MDNYIEMKAGLSNHSFIFIHLPWILTDMESVT